MSVLLVLSMFLAVIQKPFRTSKVNQAYFFCVYLVLYYVLKFKITMNNPDWVKNFNDVYKLNEHFENVIFREPLTLL
jgi:hypothetical protein